jgi:tRNA(fMet)-specific endonuclease VapC
VYLLDTNHCSFIFIQQDPSVLKHLSQLDLSKKLVINTIVYSELILMAEKSERKTENRTLVENFLKSIEIYSIDKETAKICGELSAKVFNKFAPKDKKQRRKFKLENAGVRLNDLWIACTAIQHSLVIVSQDSDFQQINKVVPLQIECWKQAVLN